MDDTREAAVQRAVHGLFCEDIRSEMGGTLSYIGVVQQAVRPGTPYPFVFPKFAAVFWIVAPVDDPVTGFDEMFMDMPDGQRVPLPPVNAPPPPDRTRPEHTRWTATGFLRATNFTIPCAGILRLKGKIWGQVWTAAAVEFLPFSDPGQ